MTWLQAQARMRQVAKEAAAAQESEDAFNAEPKRKGKGRGRGKGKGRGRGKGKGRGGGKVQKNEQHDEDDDDMLKCTEDLNGANEIEENMENRKSEGKTPTPKHTQHAASTTTPIKSTKPPALKRLALLRSKSRSSSSLPVRGAQTKKLRTRSTKRRLEFEDVEVKESAAPAPLTVPVKKCRRRKTGGEGQGVTETKQTAEPREAPDAPPAKKSECSVERQAQKEPRVVVV